MEGSPDIRAPGVVNSRAPSVYRGVQSDAGDGVLLACAREGDGEAFALLYRRYKLEVWNLAFFKLSDRHEAEDTVQETFLRAYRGLHGFRRPDLVRTWLLTICRNVCIDRLRARPRRPVGSLDDGELVEPVAPVHDQDRRIDLRRALAELPPEDREAFFLVDVLGCRSEEAARIAGLRAASTLRSRLARARRHILPALEEVPGSAPAGAKAPGAPASHPA